MALFCAMKFPVRPGGMVCHIHRKLLSKSFLPFMAVWCATTTGTFFLPPAKGKNNFEKISKIAWHIPPRLVYYISQSTTDEKNKALAARPGNKQHGEVSERFKVHDWKSCWRRIPSRGFESPSLRHKEKKLCQQWQGFFRVLHFIFQDIWSL